MIGEFNVMGILIPSVLPCALVGYLIYIELKRQLTARGFYKYVWHQPLFNVALVVICVGCTIGAFHMITTSGLVS